MALPPSDQAELPGVMIPGNHSRSEAFKLGLLAPRAPVFCRERPVSFRKLGNRGLALILKEMGDKLNLHLHPHKFRHTAIRNWVRAGMPLQAIMQLSDHTSLRMIEHYSRLENDDIRMIYAAAVNANGQTHTSSEQTGCPPQGWDTDLRRSKKAD